MKNELQKMIIFAKSLNIKEYQLIRRFALNDNFIVDCFNHNMSVAKIELCEYMHNEVNKNGKLINFPYTWE